MKILKYIAVSLIAGAGLMACNDDPELQTTDVGPEMKILSSDASALFGSVVRFEVSMTDQHPLSTLKGQLYFDDEMVAETVIRTKTNGTYEGTVAVPFYKEISDGAATLRLVGQNTLFGLTTLETQVAVSRPDPDHIFFVSGDTEYRMERTAKYQYSVTAEFPQKPKGYFRTDELDDAGNFMTFGWVNGAVATDSTDQIPLSNALAGEFAVTFNLLSFEASPFIKLLFNGVEMEMVDGSHYQTVQRMAQNESYELEGIGALDTWTIDPDWFELQTDGKLKALPIDGNYCITVNTDNSFISAYTCDASGAAAKFDTATGKGALWIVGEGLGKPKTANAPGWVPENGICLSPVADGSYQVTAVAGLSMSASSINFKFFGQNDGWGPVELKGDVLSADSDLILVGTGSIEDGGNGVDSGNVSLIDKKTFDAGGVYVFTLRWANGKGVLSVVKSGEVELPAAELKINGQKMEQLDADNYQLDLALSTGDKITPSDFPDAASWWVDDNYLKSNGDGTFAFTPLDGRYRIMANTALKFVFVKRINADGTDAVFADDGSGACWLMAWGIGAPSMDYQFGFSQYHAYCMPEVEPHIYRITGKAGPEKGSSTGTYFRTDYISAKYFHQNDWGGEMTAANTTLAAGTEALLKLDGNLSLADGVSLEEGATYQFTIDATGGKDHVVVSLVKK
mgnify:CR=1 FL=1